MAIRKPMVNKPLIRPYFWGGTLGRGRLTSHVSRILYSLTSFHRYAAMLNFGMYINYRVYLPTHKHTPANP